MSDISKLDKNFAVNNTLPDEGLRFYNVDNAPNPTYLESTHEKMFKAIRAANPELPVIFMSKPRHRLNETDAKCLEIIKKTYENARASGDVNVYLVDNVMLTALCHGEGLVDGTHPTDFGFASMAKAVGDVIEKIKIEEA